MALSFLPDPDEPVLRAARSETERHPDDAEAWLRLGVALSDGWRLREAEPALTRATQLSPTLAAAWAALGYVQMARGRLDEGIASCRRASRLRPDLAAPHRHRAAALLAANQLDAAATAMTEARQLEPESVETLLIAATVWWRAGLRDGARRLLDRVTRLDPDRAEVLVARAVLTEADAEVSAELLLRAVARKRCLAPAYHALAVVRQRQHRLDEALVAIARACELHPDSEEFLLVRMGLLEASGDAAAAMALAEAGLREHPRGRLLRLRLAMLLLEAGQLAEARRHIPGVRPDAETLSAWQVLGTTWQAFGRDRDARICLDKARPGGDAGVPRLLARSLMRLGEHDAALDALETQPLSADVAVLRAEAMTALRRPDEALSCLRAGLELAPDDALTHLRLGILYRAQAQPGPAEVHLRAAMALVPQEVAPYEQLAILFSEQQRFDDAVAMLTKAIDIAPGQTSARFNLAVVRSRQQRWQEAERGLRELLPVLPLNLHVRGNYGQVLAMSQRHDDAADVFAAVIEMTPRDPGPRQGLINALSAMRRFDEAVAAARAWAADVPNDAIAWRAQAVTLAGQNHPDASAAADRVEALVPGSVLACETRGLVALGLFRPQEAIEWFDRGLALAPHQASLIVNRSIALEEVSGLDVAVQELERAIAIEPQSKAARMNLSMMRLRLGRYDEGWRGYEARDTAIRGPHSLVQLKAERGHRPDLSGATVLVRAEQGLGDTVQFMRYVRHLARDAKDVWFHVQDAIAWMAWGLAPNVMVSGYRDPAPLADCQVALLSLPGYYETRIDSIPSDVPYIQTDPARVARWRERIGADGFKVGLVWHTNPMHGNTRRWIPLSALLPLGRLPGVRLIALQKQFGLDQLDATAGASVETLGADFDEGPDAFADAAAVIESLDLVISIDTSMAHLAGALGRPVWTLLPRSSDWRWLTERADTPWYPTMRLFRQTRMLDWSGVAQDVHARLQAAIDGHSSIIWSTGGNGVET